ncbi:hypothetical protein [Streptomyces koelreuteriae]|uniref:hypothetical protein n=1 Tax=Streptomyces koelreuteriae TaxID=2838015 RepID=UPI003EB9F067
MVFISPRALQGSRRHRLAVGIVLLIPWLVFGVVLTGLAVVGQGLEWAARVGSGAGAVSSWLLVWWCARYWYAAFSEGRRDEPVAEPDPWPWLPPPLLLAVAMGFVGVRQVVRGDGSGWFGVGLAVVFGGPAVVMVVGLVTSWVSDRRRRNAPPPAEPAVPVEPPRPRRDWGAIGR